MGELEDLLSVVTRKQGLRRVNAALHPIGLDRDVAGVGSSLVQAVLPKHMRRRAMSYNVKRLPLKLRQVILILF